MIVLVAPVPLAVTPAPTKLSVVAAVDNDDPFNTDKSKGVWIQEGPHLMMLMPASLMKDMPRDPYAGGPYVMWEGNDFVHVMVPLEVTENPNK